MGRRKKDAQDVGKIILSLKNDYKITIELQDERFKNKDVAINKILNFRNELQQLMNSMDECDELIPFIEYQPSSMHSMFDEDLISQDIFSGFHYQPCVLSEDDLF